MDEYHRPPSQSFELLDGGASYRRGSFENGLGV